MTDTALILRLVRSTPASVIVTSWLSDGAVRPPPAGASLGGSNLGGVVIDDRILRSPIMSRELAADLASLTLGSGAGVIELANADGLLDGARADQWLGATLWLWDMSTPINTALFLFSADCGRGEYLTSGSAPKRVMIPLLDVMARLDRTLLTATYSATNNGTTILYEGETGTIGGLPKPHLIGDMSGPSSGVGVPAGHIPGVAVNATTRTFQVHNGAIEAGLEVFDRGGASGLAFDGDYAGSAFDARILPAASFCTDRARGLVKVTTGLIGPMSFGARRGDVLPPAGVSAAAAPGRALADILALANTSGGAKAGLSFSAAALAGTMPSGPCGWWFDDSVSVRDALSVFARAGGGVLVPKRDGVLGAIVLGPPSGAAALTLDDGDIVAIEPAQSAPSPVGEVRVRYGKTWTQFEGNDLVPSLNGTPAAARLGQEWRTAIATSAITQTRAGDWRVVTIDTALRSEATALAIAASLQSALGLRADGQARRIWTVTMEVTAARLALDLGATVLVNSSATGINEAMVLVGEKLCSPRSDLMEWSLWA